MEFVAKRYAGEIRLAYEDKLIGTFKIRVMDHHLWQEYEDFVDKVKKSQKALSGELGSDKQISGNGQTFLSLTSQLMMFLDGLKKEHLRGFTVGQLTKILTHVVTVAMSSMTDDRTEEEKKSPSVAPSKRSSSRRKVSHSA